MKILFVTLGCAKNLVDSEKMLTNLINYGFEITDDPTVADIAIINTCAFIDEAKSESIEHILEIANYKKNGQLKFLVVVGCMAQRYKEQLYKELPEIDLILDLSQNNNIAKVLYENLSKKFNQKINKNQLNQYYDYVSLTPPFWSYLKIADGCNNPCNFCIIPKIRGKYKSVPLEDLIKQVEKMNNKGVQEINIIAQDTTNYGRDLYGKPMLTKLIQKISEFNNIKWIRILYTYPNHLTYDLINEIANNPKVCKYIDIPFQHVTTKMLKLMGRNTSIDKMPNVIVEKLRENIPNICIRSSFIIGHPGETLKDIDELINFLKTYKIEKAGFFRYSNEEDTKSYNMSKQVSEKTKLKRLNEVTKEYDKILKTINLKLRNIQMEFLIEDYDEKKDMLIGRSFREAPEVDGFVYIKTKNAKNILPGTFINAKITHAKNFNLYAEEIIN